MNSPSSRTWPDLAEGLCERLTGRDATITYEFAELAVEVPDNTGADAPTARGLFAAWRGMAHGEGSSPSHNQRGDSS